MTAEQFAEVVVGIVARALAPVDARLTVLEDAHENGGDPAPLDVLELRALLHGDRGHERHLAIAMNAMRETLSGNLAVIARGLEVEGFTEAEIVAAVRWMKGEHERMIASARGELAAELLRTWNTGVAV